MNSSNIFDGLRARKLGDSFWLFFEPLSCNGTTLALSQAWGQFPCCIQVLNRVAHTAASSTQHCRIIRGLMPSGPTIFEVSSVSTNAFTSDPMMATLRTELRVRRINMDGILFGWDILILLQKKDEVPPLFLCVGEGGGSILLVERGMVSSLASLCCSFTKFRRSFVSLRPEYIFFLLSSRHVLFAHVIVFVRCLQEWRLSSLCCCVGAPLDVFHVFTFSSSAR